MGQMPNDGSVLVQAPASGIRIDRVDFYQSGRGEAPWWGSECVAITNVGSRPINQVTLDFAWTQPSGTNEFDEIEVLNGPLAPGVAIGMLDGRAANSPSACRPTSHGLETGSFNGDARTFVTSVVYQNGPTWSLVPPVAGSAINGHGYPVTLSNVNTYGYASPTTFTEWHVPEELSPLACSVITNRGTKAITDVRITYRHLTMSGTDLGDDSLDVHAAIPARGRSTNACRSFVASIQPGLLAYAERATSSSNPQTPDYLYKGLPSVVSAQVSGATFADGTSWQSPPASAVQQSQIDGPVILQLPSSDTRVERVDFHNGGYDPELGIWGSECAATTNTGDSPTSLILYDFAWTRPYGAAVVDEIFPFLGPLAPGATVGLAKGHAVSPCWATFYGAKNYAPDAQAQVFVFGVYRKGVSWSLVPPVAGSAANAPGSPVLLSDVATIGYSALMLTPNILTVKGIPSFPPGPPESVCSTIQNETAKTITDVRIGYRHLSADGVDLGDDQLDVHANIPAHAIRKYNCHGFYATMEPSLLAYAQMSQQGPGLEPTVYLYKGVPSVISAEVGSVSFVDGTSWKLP